MHEIYGEYSTISERMRAVRVDLFGEDGGWLLAILLGISERKLTRLETHGPIPGHTILAFIEATKANPDWLLSGEGERYSQLVVRGQVGRRLGRMDSERST